MLRHVALHDGRRESERVSTVQEGWLVLACKIHTTSHARQCQCLTWDAGQALDIFTYFNVLGWAPAPMFNVNANACQRLNLLGGGPCSGSRERREDWLAFSLRSHLPCPVHPQGSILLSKTREQTRPSLRPSSKPITGSAARSLAYRAVCVCVCAPQLLAYVTSLTHRFWSRDAKTQASYAPVLSAGSTATHTHTANGPEHALHTA